jgi:DNA-binding transcriptional ArsR family regulator
MRTADILFHPVRLRIVLALSGGRTLTTAELCARLPDASKATVYRQIAILVENDFLEIESERRSRGAVERTYRLRRDRALIGDDEIAALTTDDHRHGFATSLAALLAEFNAYLDRGGADPLADSVGYRQVPLWLSPTEVAEVRDEIVATVRARLENGPTPERRRYLFSPIFFPVEVPREGESPGSS